MRGRFVCTLLAAVFAAAAATAEDPTQPRLGSGAPSAPTLTGSLQLSLADAVAMGLENNLGVEIQRHQPLIAYQDYKAAWGAYDPTWVTDFGYASDRAPNSNLILGVTEVESDVLGGSGGIRTLVPWLNTSISTIVDTARSENNTQIQTLSPDYKTGLTVIARQPLLRGLIWNEPWTLLRTNRVIYDASLAAFRRDVMDTLQAIENAYWALVANDERVRVAEKSLEAARALLDQVNTQFEVGVVSKVEIAQAEAGVADREFNLIVAQNVYRTSMDNLIDLVLGPNLSVETNVEIEPTDRPDQTTSYEVDLEQAKQIAFAQRPELDLAQQEIERLEINLKFAQNQRLPQLDVEGRFGHDGESGEANPAAPPGSANPIFFGDWTDSFDRQANSYGVRGIVTVPLGNFAGRHGVSAAELELRRAYVQKRRVEQDVILEIRKSVRDIASAEEGIEAAQRGVAAAAEQLRAERIRLEYGESTPFDVLLRE
jgi:outer membrane protein TolC